MRLAERRITRRAAAAWVLCVLPVWVPVAQAEEVTSAVIGHAWSEAIGWVNFAPAHGGVTCHDGPAGRFLSGFAWSENTGWMKLGSDGGGPYGNASATDWGVNVAVDGTMSGFAWSETMGWVNLGDANGPPVAMEPGTGLVGNYAWGESCGWIHFGSEGYGVMCRLRSPTVMTQAADGVATTSASGYGTLIDLGWPLPHAHGLCWNTTGMPTIADSVVGLSDAGATGAFHALLEGLTPNTLHYMRAFATNSAGTGYGNECTFHTLAATPVAPTVSDPTRMSLDVTVGAGDWNPPATGYAIQISPLVGGNSWVQADGSVGLAEAWRTAAEWDTTTVVGLAGATAYMLSAKARNGEGIETALGSGATGATHCLVAFGLGVHGTHTGGGALVQTVAHGEAAVAPEFAVEEGWRFMGWSAQFGTVIADIDVVAQFEPKLVPAIAWAAPATVVYGTPLSDHQLSATADTPGRFVYTPAAGAVLSAGPGQVLRVDFAPDDPSTWMAATTTVTIDVTRAQLTVRADDKTRPYNQVNPPLSWTVVGFVAGDSSAVLQGTPELACAAVPVSPVEGSPYPILISRGTLTATNYAFSFVSGALTIVPGSPMLSWAAPQPVVYGTALSVTQLNADAHAEGTITYAPGLGAVLPVGTHSISAAFTPADPANWAPAELTAELTVRPALLTIRAQDNAKTYGDTVAFAGTEFTSVGLLGTDAVTTVTLTSAGASASATVAASPYIITPSSALGSGLENYAIDYLPGELTVTPAPLTCRADDRSRPQGLPNPPFSISYDGLRNEDSAPAVPPTATCAADLSSAAGTYPIVLIGGDDPNYALALVPGTLTVTDVVDVLPQGYFGVVFGDAADPAKRCLWDFSGSYLAPIGGYGMAVTLQHDPKGRLTAFGSVAGFMPNGAAVDIPVSGKGRVSAQGGGALTAVLSVSGALDASRTKLKVALALDEGALAGVCAGSVSSDAGGRDTLSAPCVLALDPVMDGLFELGLDLTQDARGAVAGTGTLRLANARTLALLVRGKLSRGLVTLQLTGDKGQDPLAGAVRLKMRVRTLSNRTADVQSLSGKAFGQTLTWP